MLTPATDEPRISLLYVDDEPSLLEIARLFLERTGNYTVSTCDNPHDALRIIPQVSFDAIISDYQMPGCDGISFLKHLRKIGNTTPFIIFTGRGREDVVIQALNEGADFYLQKGGDPQSQFAELSNKIRYAITRRQAEVALRESEERYKSVVETQSEFICRFLPDGTHIFVNEAYCRLFNKRAEDLIGSCFRSVIHPDDSRKVTRFFATLTPDQPVGNLEQRIILPDGKIIWHRVNTRAFFDEDGTLREYQSVGRDITELMERERQLQDTNEELHAAYEQLTVSEEELRHNLEELTAQELALRRKKKELEERYRFEEIVRQNVSRFIKTDTFDQNIMEALADIGAYCGASRSYIFEFRGAEAFMDNTYEWCAEDVRPEMDNLQNLPTTLFPWWMAHLRNGEIIYTRDISLLPQEASAEREILEPQGVKSIIVLPLTIQNRLIGFIGLDNVRGTEEWSDEAVALLRIYSDFLGNVFERRQNWKELQDQNLALLEAKERIAASEEEIRSQLDENIAIQHKLALSEERYRAIFEHTEAPTVILEEDTSISLANSAFAEISGYSQEEVIGRSWTEFVSTSDLTRMLGYHRQRRGAGADPLTQYEFTFINRYGGTRSIHLTVGMIPGTRLSVGSFHDLTEVKQAEAALRESDQKYRLIAENTADLICIHDLDLKPLYVSPSVEAMKGFTVEEAYAQTIDEIWTPESYASILDLFTKEMALEASGTADPERVIHFDTEEYCKDGSTILVENSVRLLRDDIGRPVAILGISRDITERKAAEEALRASKEQLETLSNNIPNSMIYQLIVDPDGNRRFTSVSAGVERMHGIPQTEALKNPTILYDQCLEEDDKREMVEAEERAIATMSPFSCEGRFRNPDGEIRWSLIQSIPKQMPDGSILWDGIEFDITERKAVEEALHTANKKLQLLSGITRHDIQNRIMALEGYLDLTRTEIEDPTLLGYLSEIGKAATAIQKQIDFTGVYEGLGVQIPIWQSLSSLIASLHRDFRFPILYECPEISVYADPMLESVLHNLYDNTIRYADGAASVRIRCEDRDGDLMITWEDNGPGIPPAQKERIFDKGFGENTGFGLFLTREILSITAISIRENGVPGEGARFEIRVPAGGFRVA